MATLTADRRVILGAQGVFDRMTEGIVRAAIARWAALGSYRDSDIDKFVAYVVPLVASGQKQVGQLTVSYLNTLARLAGVEVPRGIAAAVNPRGVDLEEVYRRPAIALYTALSEKKPLDTAIALGRDRIDQLVRMDMQLARTHSSREWARGTERVVGYRRVLAPGENCALCAIASTQRYHKSDLMPIHDRCRCSVAPIFGTRDPGRIINEERYGEVRDALDDAGLDYTAGRFKTDRSVRIRTHGEHGPTLTWADQEFTAL